MPTKTPTPIELDDLFRLKSLQSAAISPDGRTVAYAVSHIDGEGEAQAEHVTIWLVSAEGGQARQLTAGRGRDSEPCWSPDGKRIAFLSNRSGTTQVYVISVEGGEAHAITSLPRGAAGGPVWSPDGKWLAFSAGPQTPARDPHKPYRLTRQVIRYDGMGYLDDVVNSLYVVSPEGGEARRLTDDACHNTSPVWSPDSREILYSVSMWPDHYFPDMGGLRVINLAGEIREITGKWGYAISATWQPDGKRIVFMGAPIETVVDTRYDLYSLPAGGGEPQNHTASLKYGVGGHITADVPALRGQIGRIHLVDKARAAVVHVHIGGAIELHRVSLTGPETSTPVARGERVMLVLDGNEGHLLYGASTFTSPPELYIANLDGTDERQLTRLNEAVLAGIAQSKVQNLQFFGPGGVPVEAWLVMPPHGQAPYPTVLYPHGGPNSAYGYKYYFDLHYLAAAGYASLVVNYRGSTGYGFEFATEILGDLGNLDYADNIAAVEAAIAAGLADPDRLAICGASYGGFLTCWAVGHTDRFKAAIGYASVTNHHSMYGAGDVPGWMEQAMGGPPDEVLDNYIRCSPLTYAHNCKTPTLLMVGEHDYRCPAEQTEQFYTTLKANGCVTEMIRFPECSHGSIINGALVLRRTYREALLDWLVRYMPA